MMHKKILQSDFRLSRTNKKIKLIDFWDIADSLDLNKSYYNAKEKLRGLISVGVSEESPLVTISVKTEDPVLSAEVSSFIVREIEKYIINEKSKIHKSKEREINRINKQYEEELILEEESLKKFELENYNIIDDPIMQLSRKRLERNVAFLDQVHSFLTFENIQTIIDQKSNEAIHILDVEDPDWVDFDEVSPKKVLILLLTVIVSSFGYCYYLLLRRKFEQ